MNTLTRKQPISHIHKTAAIFPVLAPIRHHLGTMRVTPHIRAYVQHIRFALGLPIRIFLALSSLTLLALVSLETERQRQSTESLESIMPPLLSAWLLTGWVLQTTIDFSLPASLRKRVKQSMKIHNILQMYGLTILTDLVGKDNLRTYLIVSATSGAGIYAQLLAERLNWYMRRRRDSLLITPLSLSSAIEPSMATQSLSLATSEYIGTVSQSGWSRFAYQTLLGIFLFYLGNHGCRDVLPYYCADWIQDMGLLLLGYRLGQWANASTQPLRFFARMRTLMHHNTLYQSSLIVPGYPPFLLAAFFCMGWNNEMLRQHEQAAGASVFHWQQMSTIPWRAYPAWVIQQWWPNASKKEQCITTIAAILLPLCSLTTHNPSAILQYGIGGWFPILSYTAFHFSTQHGTLSDIVGALKRLTLLLNQVFLYLVPYTMRALLYCIHHACDPNIFRNANASETLPSWLIASSIASLTLGLSYASPILARHSTTQILPIWAAALFFFALRNYTSGFDALHIPKLGEVYEVIPETWPKLT